MTLDMDTTKIDKEEVRDVLSENILKFWIDNAVDPRGGFWGRISGDGFIDMDAPKGAVLNSRILWAFSASYAFLRQEKYLDIAKRAYEYLRRYFFDEKYGGVFWSVNSDGSLLDGKKQIYAQAFAIYGFCEYYAASGEKQALDTAVSLFECIESYSCDHEYGGYLEAMARDWTEMEDVRLSDKDKNEKKTMNTHLHILEAYSSLYKAWPDPRLKKSLMSLLDIFMSRIYDPSSGHIGLFYDTNWERKEKTISYGHEIEASWLLVEAAMSLGDDKLLESLKPIARKIGISALEGVQDDGSMIYERRDNGEIDTDRHWWVQAETVVGSLWLWKCQNFDKGIKIAADCWNYIKKYIIDWEKGEWFWSCNDAGIPNKIDDKVGIWKCPYHNTRMCLQALNLL